jgi:hypothetical protein
MARDAMAFRLLWKWGRGAIVTSRWRGDINHLSAGFTKNVTRRKETQRIEMLVRLGERLLTATIINYAVPKHNIPSSQAMNN